MSGLTAGDGEVAAGGGVPALGNSKTNGTEGKHKDNINIPYASFLLSSALLGKT